MTLLVLCTGELKIGICAFIFIGERSHQTDSFSQSMTFIHQLVFKTQSKIILPCNICHSDLHLLRGQMSVILTHNPKV